MIIPSILTCKDSIIKYSENNVTFYKNNYVYKQFKFNSLNWVKELFIVKYLNHPNIIKFINCEIMMDYFIDIQKKEIRLDEKEVVVRMTMHKYDTTLDKLDGFDDDDIFFIIDKLIAALLYCRSKCILHRDIKENNIFINYKINNESKTNHRILSNIVLADFNISKYKYLENSDNKSEIMTKSHRSPEIFNAVLNKTRFVYDERVDVWSLCIVISFLITGKSFYNFLKESYLIIDDKIMLDATKLKIIMIHFIKIYANSSLLHLNFYKKIINDGMCIYLNRINFDQLHNIIYGYSKNNNIQFSMNHFLSRTINKFTSINITYNKNILIHKLHKFLCHNDVLLTHYYNIYKRMINHKFVFNENNRVALYILLIFLLYDVNNPISYYINIIKAIKNLLITTQQISNKSIETAIISIVRFNKYNLI